MELDARIVLWLNHLASSAPSAASLYDSLAQNNFFRGLPLFAAISFLWFDQPKQRLRIAFGLLAASLATLVAVIIQRKLPLVHLRPFLDPALGIRPPASSSSADWSRSPNGFFSDTAAMYGGLVAIILVLKRAWGLLALIWFALLIALPRVVFGYHYASDILVGAVFGIVAVLISMRLETSVALASARLLIQRHDKLVSTVFVLWLSEMDNLFFSTRGLISAILSLFHG